MGFWKGLLAQGSRVTVMFLLTPFQEMLKALASANFCNSMLMYDPDFKTNKTVRIVSETLNLSKSLSLPGDGGGEVQRRTY